MIKKVKINTKSMRNAKDISSELYCEDVQKRFVYFERGDTRRLLFSDITPPNGFDALSGVSLNVQLGNFWGF